LSLLSTLAAHAAQVMPPMTSSNSVAAGMLDKVLQWKLDPSW
jgi:hypothetical protein